MSFDGVAAFFSKGEKRFGGELRFTADGGTVRCFVSGLEGGLWLVLRNGKEIAELTVEESSGLAVFSAEAGNIVMIKKS